MSLKVKFRGNSSTPVRAGVSENLSVPASPIKGNKYKNFLTSVLTPSHTKKWLKRKKSSKSEESVKGSKSSIDRASKGSQTSDEFSEPEYSTVKDLQLKQTSNRESEYDSCHSRLKFVENVGATSNQPENNPTRNPTKTYEEPVYAVVNKQKKICRQLNKSADTINSNLIEEQKEEIKLLTDRMKELSAENRELHKSIERILKEDKWKEDSLHAELKLKITKLEADTHKEVKCLSDQIKTLLMERKVLSDQIHTLHEEKQLLQVKYEEVCNKVREMVSRDFMKKMAEEHEKILLQAKKRHSEEIKKLQQENEMILEDKITLISDVEELKEKVDRLSDKHERLKNSEKELLNERKRLSIQLGESKEIQQEAQNMLLSLLKITENISIERDVLINKASFQDHQQKLLQTSIVDYSVNMGRLQEHFSNVSKEKSKEMQKLRNGEHQKEESLKHFYERQLEMLRTKVLSQSDTIHDLQSEKKKLERQLESLRQKKDKH